MKHFWSRVYGLFRLRIQIWKEEIFKEPKQETTEKTEYKPTLTLYTRNDQKTGWTKKQLK